MITINDEQLEGNITRIRVFRDGRRIDEFIVPIADRSSAITAAYSYHAMKDRVSFSETAAVIVHLYRMPGPETASDIAKRIISGLLPDYEDVVEKVEVKV